MMAPQMMFTRAAMMAGGTAWRLNKGCFCEDRTSGGGISLFPSLKMKMREHRDKPAQNRKRMVKFIGKSKELIRAIPREGTRANETLFER